jgi:hypothetical protein
MNSNDSPLQSGAGAFVEVAPVRRIVRPVDAAALGVLLIASLVLHAVMIARTTVTARDSLRFARTALNLEHPNIKTQALGQPHRDGVDVLRDQYECPDPPGFPALVLAAAQVVRHVHDAPVPEQMLLSAQVASALAGVLLVIPSFWLGRMLFNSAFVGFAAALLFQVLPVSARVMSDGLSDSLSMLGITTAMLFGVRAVRKRSTIAALACGLNTGLAYLVRPEGLLVALAVAATIGVLALGKHWPRSQAFGRLVAVLTGLMLAATPYMVVINGVSNKPSVKEAIHKLMPWRMQTQAQTLTPHAGLLAEWYPGQGSQVAWAVSAIVKETLKTSHYSMLLMAVIGIYYYRQRLRQDAGLVLVLVLGAMHGLLLFAMATKTPSTAPLAMPPYVSERHTLLLAWLACLFAAAALRPLSRIRFGEWLLLAALAVTALPVDLKRLHENREGHVHAGRYLAGVVTDSDAVVDPFDWADWYAGRTLYFIPGDPPEDRLTARWVVWEPTAGTKSNPHSRLPRLQAAAAVVNDGANPPKLMFQWPEGVPAADAKVVVYRQDVKRPKP